MGRKVTCKLCKNNGDSDIFYKVTDEKGKNKYYCSKEEFENHQHEMECRYNLLKYVAEEVLQYEEGQIVPPSMVKKIQELHKFYNYEVIHKCFEINRDTIQYWITAKNFSSEYGMASYVMKIIEGNINDVYKKWKYEKQRKQRKQKTKNNDNEFIMDFDVIENLHENNKESSNRDISNFLDEEDF